MSYTVKGRHREQLEVRMLARRPDSKPHKQPWCLYQREGGRKMERTEAVVQVKGIQRGRINKI